MRNLSAKGLSMSQAQSISNLCNQRAQEIANTIAAINNVSKTIKIDEVEYVETEGVPLPENVIDLIMSKAKLHACQGFLVEAIKSKDNAIEELRKRTIVYDIPRPEYKTAESEDFDILESVNESWGWSQLTDAEYNEYLMVDSLAAHIGQFIHKRGKLDILRLELPTIKGLEWLTIKDGEKTPVKVAKHHTAEQLHELHEKLAHAHREYEQRVNYFKAKVKNLVTMENARRHKENAVNAENYQKVQDALDAVYRADMNAWTANYKIATQKFEEARELMIKETAALRINVDPRFQEVVDMFLTESED